MPAQEYGLVLAHIMSIKDDPDLYKQIINNTGMDPFHTTIWGKIEAANSLLSNAPVPMPAPQTPTVVDNLRLLVDSALSAAAGRSFHDIMIQDTAMRANIWALADQVANVLRNL